MDDEDEVLVLPDVEEEPPEPFDEPAVDGVEDPPEVSEELEDEDEALAVSFLSPPVTAAAPAPWDEPLAAARESVL